jgi:hypothetical protein
MRWFDIRSIAWHSAERSSCAMSWAAQEFIDSWAMAVFGSEMPGLFAPCRASFHGKLDCNAGASARRPVGLGAWVGAWRRPRRQITRSARSSAICSGA